MPIYQYINTEGIIIEIYKKMGKAPKKITRKGIVYDRHFTVPIIIMDLNEPKTIGALAEKNTAKMIKNGDSRIKKKKAPPFWRKNRKKPLNIKGWSNNKIKKYVEEGKE